MRLAALGLFTLTMSCADKGERRVTGETNSSAIDALVDYEGEPASWEDVQDNIVLTRASVVLREDATVGQLNDALLAADATLARSVEGVPLVIVHLNDVRDVGTHLDRVAALNDATGVWVALDGSMGRDAALPANVAPGDPEVDHIIASRAPAAWNARAALGSLPTVGIVDRFGAGKPSEALHDATFIADDFGRSLGPLDVSWHGYFVTSVIDARHGGDDQPPGKATGMIGDTIPIRAFDLYEPNPQLASILDFLTSPTSILNHSQAYVCNDQVCPEATIKKVAASFAKLVRERGLEDTSLHVVVAGNLANGDDVNAYRNSVEAAAAHYPDLRDELGRAIKPLQNVLVVEGLNGACAWDGSSSRGHIAAQATNIHMTSTTEGPTVEDGAGTSFAVPQVVGAAALAWAVQPNRTAAQVRDILIASAGEPLVGGGDGCRNTPSAVTLDTYAAVLAADTESQPVRRALVNVVDDNEQLDQSDMELLGAEIGATEVEGWTRYDLNGNGFVGGESTVPFDLDGDGTISAREDSVGDIDVACHMLWSEAYVGDPKERGRFSVDRCDPCKGAGTLFRTDNGNGGTFDVTTNIVQSFALARLGDATDGSAVLRLTGLCPNTDHDISMRGQMDEDSGAVGNNLTMTIGTATLSITQIANPVPDTDLFGYGTVTSDANGEITATVSASGGSGIETDHAWIVEVEAIPR